MPTKPTALPLLPHFQQFISASKNGSRARYAGKKLAPGTLQQYRCVQNLLEEFAKKSHTPLTITLHKKYSATAMKKDKRWWKHFYAAFLQFLYRDKGYYDQYVSTVLKVLKTFFNYLHVEKGYPIAPFYRSFTLTVPPSTPLVLSLSQLQFLLYNKAFEASLPRHLRRTKDLFVFGCTVALRYSDLVNLKKVNLQQTPDGPCLQIHTKKTATAVRLPLPSYLLPILKRYKRTAGRYLLPRLSSTNFNLQLKDLARRAGWDDPLPKVRYLKGKPVELKNGRGQCLRFYEQVTTHTMRRTAITTLLMLGVPEAVVRRISGHAPSSKEFHCYVVLAEDYLHKQVRSAWDKFSGAGAQEG